MYPTARELEVVSIQADESHIKFTETVGGIPILKEMFWDVVRGRYYEDVFTGNWTLNGNVVGSFSRQSQYVFVDTSANLQIEIKKLDGTVIELSLIHI